MDRDLQRLQRAAEAQPTCEATARRVEQALQRTGRHDDLRARYRFKFLCPLRFEDLKATPDPRVRSCDRCRKPVHLVATPDELSARVSRGECVAFERRALEAGLAGLVAQPEVHSAGEAEAPCVVASPVGAVDLDAVTPDESAIAAVPARLARRSRLLPIGWEEGTLVLATDDPSSAEDGPGLATMLGHELRFVVADRAALGRALDAHYPEEEPTYFLMGDVALDDV